MPRPENTNPALLVALWMALVIVYAVGVRFGMQAIENDLTQKSKVALAEAGLGSVSAHFAGREATLAGVATSPQAVTEALAVVERVEGVRTARSAVKVAAPTPLAARPAPKPTPPPVAERPLPAPELQVRRVGTKMFVIGTVPEADLAVAKAALAKLPPDVVVDQLKAGEVEARPWTRQLWPLLPAVLEAPGVGLVIKDRSLMLTGAAESKARKEGLAGAVAAVAFDLTVDNRIIVRGARD